MDNQRPPLGLPEGSVRAIITLTLLVTVCVLQVMRLPVPPAMEAALGVAVGAYFGVRGAAKG